MNYCRLYILLIIFIILAPTAFADKFISFNATISKKSTQFLLPVPNNLIPDGASFQLFEMDIPIDINYKVLNSWPTHSKEKYIRLLLIEVNHMPGKDLLLKMMWDKNKSLYRPSKLKVSKSVSLVYPSPNWLAQAVLIHPKSKAENYNWYTIPQSYYANYVVNQKQLLKNGYAQEKASQWLYDRPQSIYQLFIMTGNLNWLNKANSLSNFYIDNINEDGSFKLTKKNDVKYLMPKGLLYNYFLTGSESAKISLKRIYLNSLKWDPEYNVNRGFWTERNQASALNAAISYWEASGDNSVIERINQILDATIKMTYSPYSQIGLVGCPQHTLNSHEGHGGYSPTCSPWMMALLSDALWRYYRLTGDIRASSLIDSFGDFILNHGIYWGDEKVKNIVIPKYLTVFENSRYENHDQWSDTQHTCDVAALLGKSVYVKEINNIKDSLLKELFLVLTQQCKSDFEHTKTKQKKEPFWTLSPPRRFNWMFSTTSDLPWLADKLLKNKMTIY